MTIAEMMDKLEMTREMLSRIYNIPEESIAKWESGLEAPPPDTMEMLQNAVDHHIPRTKEEVMSLPLTITELKCMCDDLIREGHGERSVLLSNDVEGTGYHGMYYGLNLLENSDTYATLD